MRNRVMNAARKIESSNYPTFRRQSDRTLAVALTIQQVEREHGARLHRMVLVLGGAAAILIVNGILITSFI